MKHPSMRYSRLAAALMLGAAAGLWSLSASADVTDLSQTPLASASNLTVLPNVLFLLDDSGSMLFDVLPDNVEHQPGRLGAALLAQAQHLQAEAAAHHRDLREPARHALRPGRPAAGCRGVQRAVLQAGLYLPPADEGRRHQLSPRQIQRGPRCPAIRSPAATHCRDWYSLRQSYYDNGSISADEGAGNQTYNNPNIKQWYGTGTTFDVQTKWPEIVYCNSSSGSVTNLDQCRRNGLANSGSADARTPATRSAIATARWGRGNTYSLRRHGAATAAATPKHRRCTSSSGSRAARRSRSGWPIPSPGAGTTVRIIPRTGTGTGSDRAGLHQRRYLHRRRQHLHRHARRRQALVHVQQRQDRPAAVLHDLRPDRRA